LKESFPPERKMQTSARYSPAVGTAAEAIPSANRRFSKVFNTGRVESAAQLACPMKRRRESE
jgi:hypothetical protein